MAAGSRPHERRAVEVCLPVPKPLLRSDAQGDEFLRLAGRALGRDLDEVFARGDRAEAEVDLMRAADGRRFHRHAQLEVPWRRLEDELLRTWRSRSCRRGRGPGPTGRRLRQLLPDERDARLPCSPRAVPSQVRTGSDPRLVV